MILGIDFLQIFLHVFNIVILFGGMYILVYKPVAAFMDNREKEYKETEEKAVKLLSEAEEKKKEYEDALSNAGDEIKKMRDEAEKEVAQYKLKENEAARAEALKIVEDAKAEGARRKAGIVDGAKKDISRMIEEAARKIMESDDNVSAFESFLKESERQDAGGDTDGRK